MSPTTRPRSSTALPIATTCVIAAAILLPGCSGAPATREEAKGSDTPRATLTRSPTRRLDAIVGSTLVVPIDETLSFVTPATKVTLDDGTIVKSSIHRVLVQVQLPGPGDTAPDQWMPVPGVWSSVAVDQRGDVASGVAVFTLELPESAAGQGLVIDGRRFAVNWIPEPGRLPVAQEGAEIDPWLPGAPPSAADRTFLLSAAVPEARSPLTRWRYRLLVDGLRPDAPGEVAFADPIIEAISKQNEDRWRVALSWLWAANPDLSSRLKERLCAFVRFPGERSVPAWSTDHLSLDRLLMDLLDPLLTPGQRMGKAEIWLTEQPQMVGWIADDGGVLDAARNVVALAGVANLSGRTSMAWGERSDSAGEPDLIPLKPWSVAEVGVPLAPVTDEAGSRSIPRAVSLHAGRFSSDVPVIPGRMPAMPPGLRMDEFIPDWTLPTWSGSEPVRSRPEWSTAALLYQLPAGAGTPESPGVPGRWELYVQCRRAPTVGAEANECVRIHLGPPERPKAVLKVTVAGELTNELLTGELASADSIEVAASPDRWSFKLTIPSSAIEADGTVRIGVERIDAALRRTTWPRPSFPWQTSPARAAVSTSWWDRAQR
ncbi:MAG: hypothetical protein ACOYN0_12510 [Phycisphaerales bacterium]